MALGYTYDDIAKALYVQLAPGLSDRTIQVDDLTIIDLDARGAVLGVEIIRPDRQWPLELMEDAGVPQDALDFLRQLQAQDERRSFTSARTSKMLSAA